MAITRELLCQIGIHRWMKWEDSSVALFPAGDRQALNTVNNFSLDGVDVENLALETKYRECKHCGHMQVKQFVRW